MNRIYNLQEAQNWFLNHSEGQILCIKAAGESSAVAQEIDNYPDAEFFFNPLEKRPY